MIGCGVEYRNLILYRLKVLRRRPLSDSIAGDRPKTDRDENKGHDMGFKGGLVHGVR
jgi:hypothetical protein